ncbi:MAG: ribonuclease R [Mycoplasma sp.]
MDLKQKIQFAIFDVIKKEAGRPIPSGILMEKVKTLLSLNDRKVIYNEIDSLVEKGSLRKSHSGSILEGYINETLLNEKYKGIISINSSLDGYVKVVDADNVVIKELFVHKSNLNGSLTGDTVECQVMDKYSKNEVQHAVVLNVIERNTKFLVGTFQLIGIEYNVELDDKRNYLKVKLQDIDNLVNGHKILIETSKIEGDVIYGRVSRILGHKDDVGMDIMSIVIAHGIEPEFSEEVNNIANSKKIDPKDNVEVRRDISDRQIITIDPATSKDLDDAIFVKKLDNGNYFLSVSIADVSHYVKEEPLYKEALDRATSVYLVDRVIPMLPHFLSNNICSLNPNEPRLCLTCDVEISPEGKYLDIDVFPSVINSHQRFSYDEVNEYYDKSKKDWDDSIKSMLDTSYELHNILRKHKYQNGYIDFDIKEPLIVVDEKCWPIDVKIRSRGIAQRMIEDFMIVANEAVTVKAEKLDMPFIYRTHDQPQIERLKIFAIEARKLGIFINSEELNNVTPKTLTKWLEANKENPNFNLISKLLLRCMSKATYTTKNIGHFGLGSNNYTHFTSPIRRFPDLIVHRLYWMFNFTPNAFNEKDKNEFKNNLEELCKHCTAKEINAVETERDVNQLKFCQYLSDNVGKIFDGTISTIKSFGMFIELENTIEGLVKINAIGKDFWIFDQEENIIRGRNTNKKFTYGQKVQIKVASVNIENRQINFEIVGFESEQFRNDHRNKNRSIKKHYN